MTDSDNKTLAWKILPWLMDLLCAILLAWAAKLHTNLSDLHNNLMSIDNEVQLLKEWRAETAGNRYTSKDHVVYAEANAKEMQLLWKEIAVLQQTWLRDMTDIKVMLARMPTKDDIGSIDNRLRQHIEDEARTIK